MCHGGWVSDVEMLGENMSRLGERVLATTGHTSSRTARCTEAGEVELLHAFLLSSTHLRTGNSKKPASASLFCVSRRRPARWFECSVTSSRRQMSTIELSKIK